MTQRPNRTGNLQNGDTAVASATTLAEGEDFGMGVGKRERKGDSARRRTEPSNAPATWMALGKALLYQGPGFEWLTVMILVFGGCCANVTTLEALVQTLPHSGNLVTFAQFLFIAVEGYYQHFSLAYPRRCFLKPNRVPLRKWCVSVILFFASSNLNNMVWEYNITVPLHIVFRSSGTGITMVIGYLFGKRFSPRQVFSTVLLTVGCIIVTLSTRSGSGGSTSGGSTTGGSIHVGILFLVVSCLLSAFMQLYNERLFLQYGNHWREGLFYQHLLALPLFGFLSRRLVREFRLLCLVDGRHLTQPSSFGLTVGGIRFNPSVVYLGLNVVTQFFCATGVNMLAGMSSALTLNIVLLVRKIVSLVLSVCLFNSQLTVQGWGGCAMVFAGATMYTQSSLGPQRPIRGKDGGAVR